MDQLGIERYKRVEMGDKVMCSHCAHVNGMIFSVDAAIDKLGGLENPKEIGKDLPFATSIPLSEFQKLNEKDIENLGMGIGCIHSNCRGFNVKE